MGSVRSVAVAGLLVLSGVLPALADSGARNWSGCYAGLHAGGLWGMVDHKVTGLPVNPSYQRDVTFRSATAGAHAGCNYQTGSLVLGIEGDLNRASIDDGVVAFQNATTTQKWRDRFDWSGTVRGRIGVAADGWHLYATAGRAYSDMEMSLDRYENGLLTQRNARSSSNGWVFGGGAEYALQGEWFVRMEYLQHRFGSRLLLNDTNDYFFRADKPYFHVVRAGITRRFGM